MSNIGAISRNAKTIAIGTAKFFGKHIGGNAMKIGGHLMGSNLRDPRVMRDVARASWGLFGGVTLATFGARMASGRGPLTSGKNARRGIPS